MAIFFRTFLMIFLAEMGDKSQLLMVAMAAEYRMRDILLGTALSLLVLNLLAVALGSMVGEFLPGAVVSLVAGIAFLCFAALSAREGAEEETAVRRGRHAVSTIFGTYFLAELGDKTQLTALTVSAGESGGFRGMLAVFAGAFSALFLADLLGLSVGFFLGKKLPAGVFRGISFVIFALCGILRVLAGMQELLSGSANGQELSVLFTTLLALLFVLICLKGRKKNVRNEPDSTESVSVQRYQ